MLKRIEEIQGIGLLHDAKGKVFTLQKATLIYANNGRGKSTLAGILRSVATGDTLCVSEKATIDGSLAPRVVLQFDNGHRVSFESGKWSEVRPELLVFDSEFIERNVHSGGTVNSGHRKNLLEFALGEKAVTAGKQEEQATTDAKTASAKVRQLTGQLSGHHLGITLDAFEKVAPVNNVDIQIEDLEKRIAAAQSIERILKIPLPNKVAEPTLDLNAFFSLFSKSLDDIQEDAERIVRAHISNLGTTSAENWLSQGRNFNDSVQCPYCGQETKGNDLIHAYRTHFNIAYTEIKSKTKLAASEVVTRTSPTIIESFGLGISKANMTADAWVEHINIETIQFDQASALSVLQELRSLLQELVAKKQASPTENVGSEQDKIKTETLWQCVIQSMQKANQAVMETRTIIESFREKLASENIGQLQQQIEQLRLVKRRYAPEIERFFEELAKARLELDAAEKRKKAAREHLDTLMEQTLQQYESTINALLKNFTATFAIERMSANFRGGSPRSEYGLKLRGKSVSLEGGPPSFSTTLSEGDKRTLAFAFFIASTLSNTNIARQVVIIDDPMCSLDLNRKRHTRTVLKQLFDKANQLIVLAHDLFFIRDLRDDLNPKNSQSQMSIFQLQYTNNGYSDFANFDVDKECESLYYKHHQLLLDFVNSGSSEPAHVAKSIRPLLEGYLQRRFPGLIPRDMMFGQMVAFIKDAPASSPVHFAKSLVDELNEINSYAGEFHHEFSDSVRIVPDELRAYSERALNLLHKGMP